MEDVSKDILKTTINLKKFIENDDWGIFRNKLGPIRYQKLMKAIANLNMGLVDAKVSIDLKRILRLPSSLHSMVGMKCMEVKNIESFDPFRDAVPKFVYERSD